MMATKQLCLPLPVRTKTCPQHLYASNAKVSQTTLADRILTLNLQ
jgi:hypothetical protein